MTETDTETASEARPEFESFQALPEALQRSIEELGWKEPMPVQRRVIPTMLAGRDLIVQAITGSGKTGAFGLPIVQNLNAERRETQALVMAPTRELASQICKEIAIMGKHTGIDTIAVYGGTAYGPQLDAFDRGVHVVVGTPGRILDHLKAGKLVLDNVSVLIFDEADELLSLGFWPDMKEIGTFLPSERQTGLFSATMPERVRSLARFFLKDPEFISLTTGGVRSPEEIEHYHYIVSAQEKESVLLRILKYEEPDSAIIFCNTRDDVRYLTRYLQRNELDADAIEGGMTQVAREKVMARIKAGELRFLVATDVAARGIDISDLSHVISYSSSDSPEVYLHRTGRTGRAGRTGTAISLISGLDIGNFRNMQNVNRMVIPERSIPSAADVAGRERQRVQVRLEHDLRELGEREREERERRYMPLVEELASDAEGKLELAMVLGAYLASPRREVASPAAEPADAAPPEREPARDSERKGGGRKRRPRRRGPRG
jgi:ATP-dependent RNA helicase DeaD